MRLSQKSQSIIEYATLLILVIIGLILMRPYVLRAINANMKSWEDAFNDSMKDEIREAIPPIPPECGNLVCERPEEDESSCCHDCGSCGDCICCTPRQEDLLGQPTWCNEDCGYCGDGEPQTGSCRPPEISDPDVPGNCCQDFPVVCPDGKCCRPGGTAHPSECYLDCPELEYCGNGNCAVGIEDPCCVDCRRCGDGVCCNPPETRQSCAASDCCGAIPSCVEDNVCETWCGETQALCCPGSDDCGACNPCAGITRAICNARGSGSCCSDNCCHRCYNVAGRYVGCGLGFVSGCNALCSP